MFGVTNVLISDMCKKANVLNVSNKYVGKGVERKQQRPAQSQYGMLK